MIFNQDVNKYTNSEKQIKLNPIKKQPIKKQPIQNISNIMKILIYINKIKI